MFFTKPETGTSTLSFKQPRRMIASSQGYLQALYTTGLITGYKDGLLMALQQYKDQSADDTLIEGSTPDDPISSRFSALKTEWDSDTAYLSSLTSIVMHPAYQQIIGMGRSALSLIIRELKTQPDHWFWALKSITGEDPVLPEHRGDLKRMTDDWIRWWSKSETDD